MQYFENPIAVMNFKLVEDLTATLVAHSIRMQRQVNEETSENFRVTMSLLFYKINKKFYLITEHEDILVSKRQLECLQCLVNGLRTIEIAKTLFLSIRSVETYIDIIRKKIGCANRLQLVKILLKSYF